MRYSQTLLMFALLSLTSSGVAADDWKSLASDQNVKLEYQTLGNQARLRFTNARNDGAQVSWKLKTTLASKQVIDNQGELKLDAGESQVLSNGPYRDAKGPQAIEALQGKISVTPAKH